MNIIATLISSVICAFVFIKDRKKQYISPIILFYALWSFVLFLSSLNLYNITKASNEAYVLIAIMLICFFIGYALLGKIKIKEHFSNKIKKYFTGKTKIGEDEKKSEKINIRMIIFYCISGLIILFNLIDIFLVIKESNNGIPMWQIRNWQLAPYGTNNPILNRRSFVEEVLRSMICAPFQIIVPPIVAYYFFNSQKKKKKAILLALSLIIIITSSIATGGGRFGIIYYIGCFFLAFYINIKDKKTPKQIVKKYKKIMLIIFVIALIFLVGNTVLRTGKGNFFKQIYKYFAISPSLLTVWLPKIKEAEPTFGLVSFFGIHTYFFRVLDTVGLDFLVPSIYKQASMHILNAELFKDIGYGNANAFVTPIYYFMIDGGYVFVCLASLFFGMITSKYTKKFEKDINIKSFTFYALMMYAIFLAFVRVQTTAPSFFIAIIFAMFLFYKKDIFFENEVKMAENNKSINENEISKEIKSKMNDLISVVVPIYKVENYLRRSVDSLINQSYKNIEIILVDDGSPDNCGKMCDEYAKKDSRIKVIHKENGGLSDARNVGIENSNGKYITFIDSDDYVELSYIEILYKTILKYDADIAIAGHTVWYCEKKIERAWYEEYSAEPQIILEKILYDDKIDISTWGKIYKTKLFREIKFPKGRLFEDSATTYKLIDASKKIAVNSLPLYNYIIRDNSISTNSFSEKKMDLIISTKEMTDYISEKYPELSKACQRRLMYAYLSTLTQFVKSKSENEEIEKQLITYIKNNRKSILNDKKVPKRDKIGIYALTFGVGFYRFMWNIYSRKTGRK